jgi:hypothetical protein
MASFAITNNAPSSASAAEGMTAFMIVAYVKMAQSLGEIDCCLTGKNVLLLGFVHSFCCNIPHHCGCIKAFF